MKGGAEGEGLCEGGGPRGGVCGPQVLEGEFHLPPGVCARVHLRARLDARRRGRACGSGRAPAREKSCEGTAEGVTPSHARTSHCENQMRIAHHL